MGSGNCSCTGSLRRYQNGDGREGVSDARQFWLEPQQHTPYKPKHQRCHGDLCRTARASNRRNYMELLQLHAEKKALAVTHSHGEDELLEPINFNVCMDCHEFFKISSHLLSRRILLRQPQMTRVFTDGNCSCNDRRGARLALAARPSQE